MTVNLTMTPEAIEQVRTAPLIRRPPDDRLVVRGILIAALLSVPLWGAIALLVVAFR